MKKRLDQYTMAQFIDIVCGDFSHIDAELKDARGVAESLIQQYNETSDPVASKIRLVENEKFGKSEAKIAFYNILLNLINVFGAYNDVRELLNLARFTNISRRDDAGMKAKIEQLLRSEESNLLRLKKEREEDASLRKDEEDTRASFDKQTAALMAHFKMPISHETISASVYANLVNNFCRQQRQQAAAK